jgi:predicted GIY-YIG superfamily endonuclease
MQYYTYIALCADGTLYTGITTDINARETVHNTGLGAKYTRGRLPISIVYSEIHTNKSEASRREYAIKQLAKKEKLKLIDNSISSKPIYET